MPADCHSVLQRLRDCLCILPTGRCKEPVTTSSRQSCTCDPPCPECRWPRRKALVLDGCRCRIERRHPIARKACTSAMLYVCTCVRVYLCVCRCSEYRRRQWSVGRDKKEQLEAASESARIKQRPPRELAAAALFSLPLPPCSYDGKVPVWVPDFP